MAKLVSTILIHFNTKEENGIDIAEKLFGRVITNVQIEGEEEKWHENTFEANSEQEAEKVFNRIEEIVKEHASFYGNKFGI